VTRDAVIKLILDSGASEAARVRSSPKYNIYSAELIAAEVLAAARNAANDVSLQWQPSTTSSPTPPSPSPAR
jgi:hypothetical protein